MTDFRQSYTNFNEMVLHRRSAIEAKLLELSSRFDNMNKDLNSLNDQVVQAELAGDAKKVDKLNGQIRDLQAELSSLSGRKTAYESAKNDPIHFQEEANLLIDIAIEDYREKTQDYKESFALVKKIEQEKESAIKEFDARIHEQKVEASKLKNYLYNIPEDLEKIFPYIQHCVGSLRNPHEKHSHELPSGTLVRSLNETVYHGDPPDLERTPTREDRRLHIEQFIRSVAFK